MEGEVELGVTQWRKAQPGHDHGKGTVLLARRGSASGIDGHVACAHRAWVDSGRGKSPAAGPVDGWSGPVGGRALTWLAGAGMPCRVVALLCWLEQSRGGERR
jgi:hypothetical protein